MAALQETNFHLPGQVGEVYRGKVGDVYSISQEAGDMLAVVRTDRISAYNAKIPELIPNKGQVLNEMSAELMAGVNDIAPNWVVGTPDPNVTVGRKTDPVKVELIVRAVLLGSAWSKYSKEDMRQLCDHTLPDGMREFQAFDKPLFTPTGKTDTDPYMTFQEIMDQGLATPEEYEEMEHMALDLFARGAKKARERGLVLADTKYEVGRYRDTLILIDEAHTPDSSRYYPSEEFDAFVNGETTERPEQLSKEFVREWLAAQGFTNQPGETLPALPPEFVDEVTAKYVNLYERMLGKEFVPADDENPSARVEANLTNYLESFTA